MGANKIQNATLPYQKIQSNRRYRVSSTATFGGINGLFKNDLKGVKMKTNILLFIAGALLRIIIEAVGSIGRKID